MERVDDTAVKHARASVSVTVYLTQELRARARATYRATSALESDLTWSDFIETAVRNEIARREAAHNGSCSFGQDDEPLRPGAPASSHRRL